MGKTLESLVGAALMLAGLLLFLSGMVMRWIGSAYSGGWVEEVTIYLIAWGMLLSAASSVALKEHVRADFLLRMLGVRMRFTADIFASLSGLAFCAAMAWFGYEVVQFALQWDERGPSMLQLPTAWYYAALPVSMALCSLRYLLDLVGLLRQGATDEADL